MNSVAPSIVVAAALCLALPVALAFAGRATVELLNRLPAAAKLFLPVWSAIPYVLVSRSQGIFQPGWLVVYGALPVCVALLLWAAQQSDPEQHGTFRDFEVLALLGIIVEFRLFERAWPAHLGGFNRILLLDAGLYGFLVIRGLGNVGFDLRPKLADWKYGLRELAFYAPIAVPLGLGLGFLHWRGTWPAPGKFAITWITIFFLIALLEETYFRGWWQNLLERRMNQNAALLATSLLFGLSHFNKGTTLFNWRYVLLATIAGMFYGRAWRSQHRIFASAITHSLVDAIWVLFFR